MHRFQTNEERRRREAELARKTWLAIAIQLFILYFLVSIIAYRLSHSDQTETQLFFSTFDALIWRW